MGSHAFAQGQPPYIFGRLPEFLAPPTANTAAEVKRLLEAGKLPILPYEWTGMQQALQAKGATQAKLGVALNEAMNQSSETDHDNAPADAIVHESVPLVASAEAIIEKMRTAVRVDYPTIHERQVTLGSIIQVVFGRGSDPESLLVVGNSNISPNFRNDLPELPDELGCLSIGSVVGKAVLGLEAGTSAAYSLPGGRHRALEVVNVQQLSVNFLTD